jgi:hypothetical protein
VSKGSRAKNRAKKKRERAARKQEASKLGPDAKSRVRDKEAPSPSITRRIGKGAKGLITGFLGSVGCLGIYVLRPSVTIEPYASLDPTRPFSQQFSIQNNSVYAIRFLEPGCGFPADSNFAMLQGINLSNIFDNQDILQPGDKSTFTCSIDVPGTKNEIKLNPWVVYDLPFGLHACKAISFRGKSGYGGNYLWTYNGSAAGVCEAVEPQIRGQRAKDADSKK